MLRAGGQWDDADDTLGLKGGPFSRGTPVRNLRDIGWGNIGRHFILMITVGRTDGEETSDVV
jgi:hypothetical protein